MNTKTHTVSHNYFVYIFYAAACSCVLLVLLYMYFLSSAVVHVVVRKDTAKDVALIQSEISDLEAKYIAAQHDMSADIAYLDGYVPIDNKIFVERTDTRLVFTDTDNVR